MTPAVVRRLLCAMDLSPASMPAWEEVQLLGTLFAAEVVLFHVVPPLPLPIDASLPPSLAREVQEAGHRQAHAGLDQILHWARDRGADLIVMGTHGWSGLLRWILGSNAHHVVQVAPVPVLTVGPGARAEERANVA